MEFLNQLGLKGDKRSQRRPKVDSSAFSKLKMCYILTKVNKSLRDSMGFYH